MCDSFYPGNGPSKTKSGFLSTTAFSATCNTLKNRISENTPGTGKNGFMSRSDLPTLYAGLLMVSLEVGREFFARHK
jgi:hypothetical protein